MSEVSNERTDYVNENITLVQSKNGLTFGTDAYLLYAYLKKMPKCLAADLGAGTGIISLLAAAKGKFSQIYAFEIQESFASLIERNVSENGFSDKIKTLCTPVQNIESDLFGRFDCVFSNPPYMKKGSGFLNANSEKYIARHEVCGDIKDFCEAASKLLKYSGSFYVVWRPDRLTDLFDAMRSSKIEPKRITVVYPDAKSRPSLVLVEGKRGAASGLFFTKPLIMHPDASAKPLVYTDDLSYIYENGEFGEEYERA